MVSSCNKETYSDHCRNSESSLPCPRGRVSADAEEFSVPWLGRRGCKCLFKLLRVEDPVALSGISALVVELLGVVLVTWGGEMRASGCRGPGCLT